MKVYVASPLGFSALGRIALAALIARVRDLGHDVLDPWSHDVSSDIADAFASGSFTDVETKIGGLNEAMIAQADAVLGVLDGMEPDSGTVAELVWAKAHGKKAYGLRTDFRSAGDFPGGTAINLQLRYWLDGLFVVNSLDELNF